MPVGLLAFALTWTLRELPLRTTTRAVDQADRLAPTSRPSIRTSDEEMSRAIWSLLSRERRSEVYGGMVTSAGLSISPRAGWLLLRVGEHRGDSRAALARCLCISVSDLESRMNELTQAGLVAPGQAEPEPSQASLVAPGQAEPELTAAGESAYARLLAARHERIERLLDGWHREQHPRLLELLTSITHELAASPERPGRDLDRVG